ncbi:hypothetical protein ACEN32_05310 [Marinilactibacillus psychrotolerans]|uniref:hypothetical protein n=1 Tax=Marinilactibacillus psychrotolerans TaxID=191770 RepID=UPI003889D756
MSLGKPAFSDCKLSVITLGHLLISIVFDMILYIKKVLERNSLLANLLQGRNSQIRVTTLIYNGIASHCLHQYDTLIVFDTVTL